MDLIKISADLQMFMLRIPVDTVEVVLWCEELTFSKGPRFRSPGIQ